MSDLEVGLQVSKILKDECEPAKVIARHLKEFLLGEGLHWPIRQRQEIKDMISLLEGPDGYMAFFVNYGESYGVEHEGVSLRVNLVDL